MMNNKVAAAIVCLTDRNDLQASSTNRLDRSRRWRAEIKRRAAAHRVPPLAAQTIPLIQSPLTISLFDITFFSTAHAVLPPFASPTFRLHHGNIFYIRCPSVKVKKIFGISAAKRIKMYFPHPAPPPALEACLAFSLSNSGGR